tara:strand:+ start:128 stop:490 length:363 start_codon:yes stop_codon:yes gene_type:complete
MSRDIERMLDMWVDLLENIPARKIPSFKPRYPVSVEEQNGTVSITVELAGFGKDDIILDVSDSNVNIAGNRKKTDGKKYSWKRSFDGLDPESTKATMINGVLDIVIEKKEKTSAKTVEIK